ncbi:unnamed protein product [Cyclocybe aegerita]|uniref:Uncharacterized protein n=1 Tax=Cyclocybe aegerita TaxID=1973307 RepID=A0A8S0W0G0_CYCAE|nr:unnamed protein product [Cyclocybe aegerita]
MVQPSLIIVSTPIPSAQHLSGRPSSPENMTKEPAHITDDVASRLDPAVRPSPLVGMWAGFQPLRVSSIDTRSPLQPRYRPHCVLFTLPLLSPHPSPPQGWRRRQQGDDEHGNRAEDRARKRMVTGQGNKDGDRPRTGQEKDGVRKAMPSRPLALSPSRPLALSTSLPSLPPALSALSALSLSTSPTPPPQQGCGCHSSSHQSPADVRCSPRPLLIPSLSSSLPTHISPSHPPFFALFPTHGSTAARWRNDKFKSSNSSTLGVRNKCKCRHGAGASTVGKK